jgi:hypothetical protein
MTTKNPACKSPSYLVRTPYSYCFRMKVPLDLRDLVGKKELRYSLKTGSLSDAKSKARLVAGQIQWLFKKLKKGSGLSFYDIGEASEIQNKGIIIHVKFIESIHVILTIIMGHGLWSLSWEGLVLYYSDPTRGGDA